jgi:CRP/FNR family cyclic AMP-dependent transcriptional regulator
VPGRRDAKVEIISRVPLFERCSKRELAAIAAIADQVELREGKVLAREGGLGREFFILTGGSAEVSRAGRRIATLGEGDFFGEIALIANVPRTASVKTVSPASALVVSTRDFWTLLDAAPRTRQKILQAVAERLAVLEAEPSAQR